MGRTLLEYAVSHADVQILHRLPSLHAGQNKLEGNAVNPHTCHLSQVVRKVFARQVGFTASQLSDMGSVLILNVTL